MLPLNHVGMSDEPPPIELVLTSRHDGVITRPGFDVGHSKPYFPKKLKNFNIPDMSTAYENDKVQSPNGFIVRIQNA